MTWPRLRRRVLRVAGALLITGGAFATGCAGVLMGTEDSTGAAAPPHSSATGPGAAVVSRRPAPSATTVPAPTVPAPPADPLGTPIWADEFTGPAGARPDPRHWHADTGGFGFGNQELECNTDSADTSALDGDGHLVITARRAPGFTCPDGNTNGYVSARLSTASLATMQYGKLRVRAQLPTATGLWPAIWALGQDHSTVGWPQSGEIDVAEAVGSTPDTVYQTLHAPGAGGNPYSVSTHYSIGQPLGTGLHTYGVDWAPDRIAFSVDGDVYMSYTRTQFEQHGGVWEFDKPFYLLLDLAVGGTFPGPPDTSTPFPVRMLVDFVRVYR